MKNMPYGENSTDLPEKLFAENQGTCITKHAVIALLAQELGLEVYHTYGLYAITEEIVTGVDEVFEKYSIPYAVLGHCFLSCGILRVDLTANNLNGKNTPINSFLYTQKIDPQNISEDKDKIYNNYLEHLIQSDPRFRNTNKATLIWAREECYGLMYKNRISLAARKSAGETDNCKKNSSFTPTPTGSVYDEEN